MTCHEGTTHGKLIYSAVKLFSKYTNISDHGTWRPNVTDRRTDDILWHNRARGKTSTTY